MLDVQRYRGAVYRDEIQFTRKVMWTHLIVGAVVMTLFLFHELFRWFAGSIVWYVATLALMYGLMNERRCCRWLLGLLFLAVAVIGVYFINKVFPETVPPRVPLVPHGFIPIWVGAVNLTYVCGGLLLLFSGKVRRAVSVGFTLW